MTEEDCLSKMKAPGDRRPGKWGNGGVIQILVTSSCNLACFNCTQLSQLQRPRWEMTPHQFRLACKSLKGYFGVVGVFGGNPTMSKHFQAYCEILREEIPYQQRGLWCNDPLTLANAKVMRETFNPSYSNLNVHGVKRAWDMFKEGWPESKPFGLDKDSRHGPPWVAMRDLDGLPVFDKRHRVVAHMHNTESNRYELIADCDINQHWSAGIGVFRGELRAWFCEIAMAQSIYHQDEPEYPDTGLPLWSRENDDHGIQKAWWRESMQVFAPQVRKHCHDCGIPIRGFGALAVSDDGGGKEQISQTHAGNFKPKRGSRAVELVTAVAQMDCGKIDTLTHYIQNAAK